MIIALIVLCIFLAIYFFIRNTEEEVKKEIEINVESIRTPKQLESLENKLLNLEEKMLNSRNPEQYKYDFNILEESLEKAQNNPFKYYHYGYITINTPLNELNLMGKLIEVEEFNKFENELKNKFEFITLSDIENISEAKNIAKENIDIQKQKDFIKLRKVLESNLPLNQKKKKYNALVSKDKSLISLFNYKCDDYYQQLKDYELLEKANAHLISQNFIKFIDAGYINLEDILKEDEKKLLEIKGIGKKAIEQIKELKGTFSY